ncbi:MAG: hypothetical protein COT17_05115 [Elusimicrobia bacterium CG08_land_8_20_14_0_20_51_18]|nr:MAG: hypothetical protein COT17_05115 [Elusimicrobia bacterium CG08_land_8_20_14_0_20_51_18]
MKKALMAFSAVFFLAGCSGDGVIYRPADQILPQHIKSISVRTFSNKTPNFGLEEKLTLKIIDELLKNGQYKVVNEDIADGVITGDVVYYKLTPTGYDSNMVETIYNLTVITSVKLLDKKRNAYMWEEPALKAVKIYSAATLPGGMSEEQAREAIWEILSKDIIKRTVEGFGSASSASEKKIPAISTQTIKNDIQE